MKLSIKGPLSEYLAGLAEGFDALDAETVDTVANTILNTIQNGGAIYVCGNGGSGANASHIVVDYLKCLRVGDLVPRIYALVDNCPTVTAISNDIHYDEIFSYQLEGYLKPGDVVWALTGSGNSENIIRALKTAKATGNTSLLFCGYDGGKAKALADVVMHYPSHDMQKCEDSQMVLANVILQQIIKMYG